MAGDLVLLTGGTGHVGFRTLRQALESGYRVRASVRGPAGEQKIKAAKSIQRYLSQLSFVVVEDIEADGAFDEAIKGCTYVVHIASRLPFNSGEDYEKDMIKPAIRGTISIMTSAAKALTVKRVVITSSIVAFVPVDELSADFPESHKVWTSDNYIPDPQGPWKIPGVAYKHSKILALNHSLRFMTEKKPHFDLLNIQPAFVIGAHELITNPADITNGTNGMVMGPVLGAKLDRTDGNYVHIDDVAKMHVDGLDSKIPPGQYAACGNTPTGTNVWEDSLEVVRKAFPKAVEAGVLPLSGSVSTKEVLIDASESEKVFGFKFKSWEDAIKSVVSHYLTLVAPKA
ncbi:MAG: hypothetical protein M1824_005156 [Vezdaea acicularis]|nr:MAG: hypothetical protein M1824_005156 [Vezdaea acicularis]